jgi:hypothetical protein
MVNIIIKLEIKFTGNAYRNLKDDWFLGYLMKLIDFVRVMAMYVV